MIKLKNNNEYSLTPQLVGLEGYRVEAITMHDEKRRFIVGKSTGITPIHLEVRTKRSRGGAGAEREYKSITKLYKVWG